MRLLIGTSSLAWPNRLTGFAATALLLTALAPTQAPQHEPVHLANGIKIGEAKARSAAIWVRVTRDSAPRTDGKAFVKAKPKEPQLPAGSTLDAMQGAVPGCAGEVRVRYWPRSAKGEGRATAWRTVSGAADFAHTFVLGELTPASTYELLVEARAVGSARTSSKVEGHFRTAPLADANVGGSFCVTACQDYPRRDEAGEGHSIYREFVRLDPDFLVHTGDTIYYDKAKPFATTVELARFKWNRFYGLPLPRACHRQMSTWFLKDDHDVLKDDCWPGQKYGELTFARGLELYREQVPVGPVPYRSVRWGRHLEVWFLEGREFRSCNRDPDGPEKTILGAEQKAWLRATLVKSDATFRVVLSPTPIVGPDRLGKRDNHANQNFKVEGDELRALLGGLKNTIVICGDRHWQYASHDPVTGLREWGCGPGSDAHSGGYRMKNRTAQHDYLKICGGFLHVQVRPKESTAELVLRHCDTNGQVLHEDVLPGK